MKIIKPFRLASLYRPFSWRGQNQLSIGVYALIDLKDKKNPKLLSDMALWREVLPELDSEGVLDLVLPKIVPEYLIAANAYTKYQNDKTKVMVKAEVAGLHKELVVFGDRYWIGNKITEPQPFESLPLTWANTYGGQQFTENPLGKGIDNIKIGNIETIALPNVEGLINRINKKQQKSQPYSFGPVNYLWPRRFNLQGTYSEDWKKHEFPGFFPNMNVEVFNAAEKDQRWYNREQIPLGKEFKLYNMHPTEACWQGWIPSWQARCFIEKKSKAQDDLIFEELAMRATTVWFIPHQDRLLIMYHGSIPVQEDDASDVITMMTALEAETNRTVEYYQTIMEKRKDHEKAAIYAFADEELITEHILAEIDLGSDDDFDSNAWFKKVNNKLEKLYHEQKEDLVAHGYSEEQINKLLSKEKFKLESEKVSLKDLPKLWQQAENEIDKMLQQSSVELDKNIKYLATLSQENKVDTKLADLKNKLNDIPKNLQELKAKFSMDALETKTPTKAGIAGPTDLIKKHQLESMLSDKQVKALKDAEHKSYLYSVYYRDPISVKSEQENTRIVAELLKKYQETKDLSSANLLGVNLSGLNFANVDFSSSYFENTNLNGCKFVNCNFSQAVLARALLYDTQFIDCNFTQANLCLIKTNNTYFTNCDFSSIILSETILKNCNFMGSSFSKINSYKNQFLDIIFENSQFKMGNFLQNKWNNIHFIDVTLWKVGFIMNEFTSSSFNRIDADSVGFIQSTLNIIDFQGLNINNSAFVYQTSLNNCVLSNSILKQCSLREIEIIHSSFATSMLDTCDFSLSNMPSTNFSNSNCKNSSFIRTNLQGSSFKQASLISSDFKAANLLNVNFTQANLFRANVALSKMDATTITKQAYIEQVNLYPIPRNK